MSGFRNGNMLLLQMMETGKDPLGCQQTQGSLSVMSRSGLYINGNGVNHLASTNAVKLMIAVEFDNDGYQT